MSMDGSPADWLEVERLLDDEQDGAALRAFTARLPFAGLFGAATLLPRLSAVAARAGSADLALMLAALAGPAASPVTDAQGSAILLAPSPETALLRAL